MSVVAQVEDRGAIPEPIDHVVLLVHGIRTRAFWQDTVKDVLEEVPGLRAIPIKFGHYSLLRFLVPGPWRRGPARRIRQELREAQVRFRGADLSVVCHSFGTYSVCKALEDAVGIELRHLILCGSVLPEAYRWHRLTGKVRKTIANDVGVKDVWPAAARLASVGFGASGTFGFGTVSAPDRFFPFAHGDFFTEEFVRNHWLPILRSETAFHVRTPDRKRPANPKWISWLGKLPSASFFAVLALALATTAGWISAPYARDWARRLAADAPGEQIVEPVPGDSAGPRAEDEESQSDAPSPAPEPARIAIHGRVEDLDNRWNPLADLSILAGPLDRQVPAEYEDRRYSVALMVADDEPVHINPHTTDYVPVDPTPLRGPWKQPEYEVPLLLQLRTRRAEALFEQAGAAPEAKDSWALHLRAWQLVAEDRYLDGLALTLGQLPPAELGSRLVRLWDLAAGHSDFESAATDTRYRVLMCIARAAESPPDLLREIEPGRTYHDIALAAYEAASAIDPAKAEPFQAKMQLELRDTHYFDAARTARQYFEAAERSREADVKAFLTEWVTAIEKGTGFFDYEAATYEKLAGTDPTWLDNWREVNQRLEAYDALYSAGDSDVNTRLREARGRAGRILAAAPGPQASTFQGSAP